MKVLVLGGTGAIGEHLIRFLGKKHDLFVTTRTRRKDQPEVKFLIGNAKNQVFLDELLKTKWDAIVDFMVYKTSEFELVSRKILRSTGHYIFTSSARVFADSIDPITEKTPKLLYSETTPSSYLNTEEYALTKARQERILEESLFKNWTVVRPYITYSHNRLQLGPLEKEAWLYRAIKGRKVLFCSELLDRQTTMTNGLDVADAVSRLIGNQKAMSEDFNVTSSKSLPWNNVWGIYSLELKSRTGIEPMMVTTSLENFIGVDSMIRDQMIYDRLLDRKFDHSKIRDFVGKSDWVDPELGLKECIQKFLENPQFRNIDWEAEISRDRLTKDITPPWEISGLKGKVKYYYKRFL